MSKLFWTSGHFGWTFFAFLVFTALGFIVIDLLWRLTNMGIRKITLMALTGWVAGIILILLVIPSGH
jgi:hypothetical protein